MNHDEHCMCDNCILVRVREKVASRNTDKAVDEYIQRRGSSVFPTEVPAEKRPTEAAKRIRSRTTKL
jgi:hypothetical protein